MMGKYSLIVESTTHPRNKLPPSPVVSNRVESGNEKKRKRKEEKGKLGGFEWEERMDLSRRAVTRCYRCDTVLSLPLAFCPHALDL